MAEGGGGAVASTAIGRGGVDSKGEERTSGRLRSTGQRRASALAMGDRDAATMAAGYFSTRDGEREEPVGWVSGEEKKRNVLWHFCRCMGVGGRVFM